MDMYTVIDERGSIVCRSRDFDVALPYMRATFAMYRNGEQLFL